MKIKNVSLKNFANYTDVSVSFDENLTYLIGKNGSGKSTIGITAIWYIMQGIAEKSSNGNTPLIGERFRFIGPKSATAKGEMVLLDEKSGKEIKVIRKLTKTGSELSFEGPEGMELNQQWLNDLFNVFLIAPKKFTELPGIDQAKAIGIDTSTFDKELSLLKEKAKIIRIELKQFDGLTEVEKTESVDLSALQTKKEEIRRNLNEQYTANQQANKAVRTAWEESKRAIDIETKAFNDRQTELSAKYSCCNDAYATLKKHGYEGKEIIMWLNELSGQIQPHKNATDLYPAEPAYITEMPDDSELKAIDQQIIEANSTNQKAFLYDQYIARYALKKCKEEELRKNQREQKEKEEDRLTYIQSLKLPFSNLSIDEEGNLLLAGKPIKEPYFSTGELLKIVPILIATRNHELKYVFLQDFNLLDEEKQNEVEEYLTGKGFQLVVEMVGKEKMIDKNCILLKDSVVVDSYEAATEPSLNL